MPRWLFFLIASLPLALLAEVLRFPPLLVFILAALAIVPLAGAISEATEDLSEATGPRIGGLLNATFGNVAELILSISALSAGLFDVVRAAISGSIIGNALLVLGSAMLVGGLRYGPQRFLARNAGQYATMLALAVIGLVIPSVIDITGGPSANQGLTPHAKSTLSLVVAVVLLVSYLLYLLFSIFGVRASSEWSSRRQRRHDRALGASAQLVRPRTLPPGPQERKAARKARARGRRGQNPATGAQPTSSPSQAPKQATESAQPTEPKEPAAEQPGESETKEEHHGIPWRAVGVLGGATVLIAVASEVLVGAIEPVTHQLGLSTFFVGLIFLPLLGNAAEFATSVRVALANQMEAAMAVTAGASIQVALLVAPVLVLISPLFGHVLVLDFTPLELVIFALVAGLFALVSLDGQSTWLEGVQLVAFYLIVATAAFVVP